MAKTTSRGFTCSNCGKQSVYHLEICPVCKQRGTFTALVSSGARTAMGGKNGKPIAPIPEMLQAQRVDDISSEQEPRWILPTPELNRVLGGGLVPGSIILLGGEPGIGKCVVGSTYLATEQGFVGIQSIKPEQTCLEDFTPFEIGVQSVDGVRQTSHFYDSGVKPTKRIETRMGYHLQGTYVHPVMTLSAQGEKCWKAMNDLQVGDFVAIQRHGAVWGDQVVLPEFTNRRAKNAIIPQFPSTLSDKTAYVLGLLIGDGCLTNGITCGLTTNDTEIQQAFQDWARELNLHVTVNGKSGTTALNNVISSRVLIDWFRELGLTNAGAHDKQVPWVIMRSTQDNVRSFLQGLFDTDGSAHKLGVEFCTVSKELAHQVHLLLLQFGIVGKLRFKTNQHAGAWIIQMQGNNARLFYKRIGFRLERKQCKQALLPVKSNNNFDVIPYLPSVDPFRIPNNYRWDRRYAKGERAASYDKARKIARFIPEINELLEPEFYWDEVIKAEDGGLAECYDLCVPETHAFVTNGIVSHNSSLSLAIASVFSRQIGKVLYASGEESVKQIKMRAERFGVQDHDLYLMSTTNLEDIFSEVTRLSPDLLIIDSIQTVYLPELDGGAGNPSQIRECATRLQALAKTTGTSVVMIGHVTKEGNVAGPRTLEHLVDTVLYLEGERFGIYRLLRASKNRFGATNEIGVFEMVEHGLVEVPNPSMLFLNDRRAHMSGSAVGATMEGTRPIMVEVQALVASSQFSSPQRTVNGVSKTRLHLIAAVMDRHCAFDLVDHDLFVSAVGGITVEEPALDLSAALAIASSRLNLPVPDGLIAVGEVGLSGELRAVTQVEMRIREAANLGFREIIVPASAGKAGSNLPNGIAIKRFATLMDAIQYAFPNAGKKTDDE